MIDYKTLYNSDPFGLEIKKDPWYLTNQKKLCLYHYKNSNNYKLIIDNIFKNISQVKKYLIFRSFILLYSKILI